jgi:polyhydroxybutyrate depolymerase
VPDGLRKGAPLVVVLHGSGETGEAIRRETGYAFERLADRYGFAVVFPDAYHGYWDVCGVVGAVKADDVAFLVALADKVAAEIGIDPNHVFAAGSSRGGSMALRLALEAPRRFRAVAAVSASVPAPGNFNCRPAGGGTSVMIMNGTKDPIVPFDGGNVSLYGVFYKNGKVLSSRASAQYFADLNHVSGTPVTRETPMGGVTVEQLLWHDASPVEVELVAIHGAGHGLPQPYHPRPRILGPSTPVPNGAEMIWDFFARQRPAALH